VEEALPLVENAQVFLFGLPGRGDEQGFAVEFGEFHDGGVTGPRDDHLRAVEHFLLLLSSEEGVDGDVADDFGLRGAGGLAEGDDDGPVAGEGGELFADDALELGALGLGARDGDEKIDVLGKIEPAHGGDDAGVVSARTLDGEPMGEESGEVLPGVGVVGDDHALVMAMKPAEEVAGEGDEELKRGEESELELMGDKQAGDVGVEEVEAVVGEDQVVVSGLDEALSGFALAHDGAEKAVEIEGKLGDEEASLGVGRGIVRKFDEFTLRGVLTEQLEGPPGRNDGDVVSVVEQGMDDGKVAGDVTESPGECTEDDTGQGHPPDRGQERLTAGVLNAIRRVQSKFKEKGVRSEGAWKTMATVSYIDIKRGSVFQDEGEPCVAVDVEHITPGNWRGMMQIKLRNLRTGRISQKRFRPQDKVELVFVEKKELEYLYRDATGLVFMDTGNYEQSIIQPELLGDMLQYLKPNTVCSVEFYDGEMIGVELPDVVELEVTETDPVVKGQTATNQYKPAVLETGVRVTVPPFISQGEVIRVDTRTGKYLERAK